MKIVTLSSLYEPLEFLENKIDNLNQCNTGDVLVYWADCSPDKTWREVKKIINEKCNFKYKLHHFNNRTTLYYTWTWIIKNTINNGPRYYCNVNVDDILNPEYFNIMSEHLDNNLDKKIIACNWLITNKKNQIWKPNYHNSVNVDIGFTLGHFPMWRASLHRDIGYFNEKMLAIGDADFWKRIKYKFGNESVGVVRDYIACSYDHKNSLYWTAKTNKGVRGEAHDLAIMKKQPYWRCK